MVAQVITWIFLLIGIIFGSEIAFIVFGFCYLVYLILEFSSPTSKYSCHKSSCQGMYEKIGKYFQTPPEIKFYAECYHIEYIHYTKTDRKGRTKYYTKPQKVVTHKETYTLSYYSERDVIDLFYLNCEKVM